MISFMGVLVKKSLTPWNIFILYRALYGEYTKLNDRLEMCEIWI